MTVVSGARRAEVSTGATPARSRLRMLLGGVFIADLLMLALAVEVAWVARRNLRVWESDIDPTRALSNTVGPWILMLWLVILALHGAYSSRLFGAGVDEFKVVFQASVLTAGSVAMICYLFKFELSRGFLLLVFVVGIPLLLLERYGVRVLLHGARSRGHFQRRAVVVGGPSGINELVGVLHRDRYAGYQIVGACLPENISVHADDLPVPGLGGVQEVRAVCEDIGADAVLVARGGYSSSRDLRQIAWDLEATDIELIVVPSLTDVAGPRIHMRPVAGLPLLHLEAPQADAAGGWSKRLFDVVGSLAALVVLSPLMLLVALAIKAEDRGPVFYRQRRVGWRGEDFSCLKFRSMYVDAELIEANLRAEQRHEGALWKMAEDPRVTRVGRVIRRFSLDELPQLFNVLVGQMSLVGPRPQQAWEVETYTDPVRRRLLVRPGMTGLWQVSGRSELSFTEAVRLDLYYVDNWSMLTDLGIILKTVRAVLGSSGAY